MLATVRAIPARSLGLMPPLVARVHRREARRQRGDGGLRAGLLPDSSWPPRRRSLDPAFNLYGVQATTHPVAPLRHRQRPAGPRRSACTRARACFGPGFRANATIGRAIRLILMNVGGGWPGRHDMATQGSPAKFSYCHRARSRRAAPWEPLHVALGFAAEQSVVTVYGGEPPHNVNDHVSHHRGGHPQQRRRTSATTLGSNVGWYMSQSPAPGRAGSRARRRPSPATASRARDVQRFVFEHARLPLSRLKLGGMWGMHDWPLWMQKVTDESVLLPAVPSAGRRASSWWPAGRASTPRWCPTAPSAARCRAWWIGPASRPRGRTPCPARAHRSAGPSSAWRSS